MATLFATRDQKSSTLFEVPVSALGLRADRTDISFENVTPDLVRVSVRVTNDGTLPAPGTEVQLQSAPLGASLTWQPLLTLAVPAVMPRQSVVISGVAWVPRPVPLGQPHNVTPAQLQEAVAAPPEVETLREQEIVPPGPVRRPRVPRTPPMTASDPFALLGRGGRHWMGNINVLMRNKAVERHLALSALRLSRRDDAAMFFVGDRKDGYRFELAGMAKDWQAELTFGGQPIVAPERGPLRRPGRMDRVERVQHCSPAGAAAKVGGARRGASPRGAAVGRGGVVVEFSLDSRAAGTGCYTV